MQTLKTIYIIFFLKRKLVLCVNLKKFSFFFCYLLLAFSLLLRLNRSPPSLVGVALSFEQISLSFLGLYNSPLDLFLRYVECEKLWLWDAFGEFLGLCVDANHPCLEGLETINVLLPQAVGRV